MRIITIPHSLAKAAKMSKDEFKKYYKTSEGKELFKKIDYDSFIQFAREVSKNNKPLHIYFIANWPKYLEALRTTGNLKASLT